MNELVKISEYEINGVNINAVSARDLWEFLGSKQQFADWIKNRMRNSLNEKMDLITQVEFASKLLGDSAKKMRALEALNEGQSKTLELQKPVVEYADKIMDASEYLKTTDIAKAIGITAATLHKRLKEWKVIYNISGTWYPMAKYQDLGYHKMITVAFTHRDGSPGASEQLKWSQAGRKFIFELWEKKTGKKIATPEKINKERLFI